MRKIIYNQYGSNEELKLSNTPEPTPSNDEALIQVKSASINPVDWKIRGGDMKMMTGKKFPRGIGCDFSGIVMKIGSDITEFKIGDEVFGWMPYKEASAFAEFLITKESLIIKKPSNISFDEMACLPMVGGTALVALKEKGQIAKKAEVLINGCTGGVGHIATQISKDCGAVTTGICSGNNIETAKELGADTVYDYRKQDVYSLNKKYDIIFDTVGNLNYKKAKALLKPNGKYLSINPDGLFDIIHGLISSKHKIVMTSVKKEHLVELAQLAEAKTIKPLIARTVSLDDAIKTIDLLEKGEKVLGKTVIVN